MNTKLMENLQSPPSFDNIMDEDFGMVNELTMLASNTQKKCILFGFCIFFWIHFFFKKYEIKYHIRSIFNVKCKVQKI
jgi:hypothetical protein